MRNDMKLDSREGTSAKINELEKELEEMSRGVVALNLELESRVEERTRELSEREQFLNNVFNSIQDGILVIDSDQTIVRINPWIERVFDQHHHVEGEKCFKLLKNHSEPCEDCVMFEDNSHKGFHQSVLPYPYGDDPIAWFNVSSFPFRDTQDKIIGVIKHIKDITKQKYAEDALHRILNDLEARVEMRTAELARMNAKLNEEITERKKTERLLREHTNELERTYKELETFSYSVSHDLRTPLRAIDGFTRILQEDYSEVIDEEGLRVMNIICDNTRKMARLIDDILRFSRSGRNDMNSTHIDTQAMVTEICNQVEKQENGRVLEFIIGDLPDSWGDRPMLREVFINLITNAVKYSRNKEKAIIEVSGETKNKMNIYSVSDNGIGFDMQYYNKLFGVFQRLHSDRDIEGTGIGLAIVKQVVERHDGKVWASSELGEGATFSISLPVMEK